MGFGEAISSCFGKYAVFSGRAQRSEYWWWFLFVILLYIAVQIASGVADEVTGSKLTGGAIMGLVYLLLLLPQLAVEVRRLHDRNHSGWWVAVTVFISLVVLILIIPVGVRVLQNRESGLPPNDGLPSGLFFVIAGLGAINAIIELIIFIWLLLPGTKGGNRYGPDPLRAF